MIDYVFFCDEFNMLCVINKSDILDFLVDNGGPFIMANYYESRTGIVRLDLVGIL